MTVVAHVWPGALEQARDAMDALTLEDVNARAGLLERQDVKYLLNEQQAAQLLHRLTDSHQVLQIDGRRAFGYDSTYFDSETRQLYRDHAQGRRLRWKARTRRYSDGPLCFREIKLKGARGSTVKLREQCPAHEHGWAGPELARFVDAALQEHYGHGTDLRLVASLSVRYERTTLASVDGVERITMDRDLIVVDDDGRARGGLQPGMALLEVKTPLGCGTASRVLAADGLRPVSLSKYGVGVALTRPDLNRSGLRQVIRQGFQEQAGSRAA